MLPEHVSHLDQAVNCLTQELLARINYLDGRTNSLFCRHVFAYLGGLILIEGDSKDPGGVCSKELLILLSSVVALKNIT